MKSMVGAARARLAAGLHPLHPGFLLTMVLVPLVAVRAYLVLRYGSSSPFWDQWDAEFDNLLLPYLRGELGIGHFFAAHNEHRILFTRLISLGLFASNGNQFDAKVEMLFNVLPHAAAIGAMAWVGLRTLPATARPLFAVGVFALAAAPLGWENLIAGFQNQFFILALLSVTTTWLAAADTLSRNRLLAMLACACLALFTMASGVFAAAAAAGLLLYRIVAGDVERRPALIGLVLMAAVAATGLLTMPAAPHGDTFHAHSLAEFLQALKMTLSWPLRPSWLSVLVLWSPTAALTAVMLLRVRSRQPLTPGLRFAFALAGWVLVQAVAMAYSRGSEVHNGVTSRYTDLLALGVINNLWLMLYASFRLRSNWPAWARAAVPTVFLGWVALSSYPSFLHAQADIAHRSALGANQERLLAGFLADGDLERLKHSPDLLPYPDADRISRVLSAPDAAAMMPVEIRRPLAFTFPDCAALAYPGSYTTLPALPHALGSYAPGSGDATRLKCESDEVATPATWLAYRQAGGGAPSVAAALVGAQHRIELAPRAVQGERWQTNLVHAPGDRYRLRIEDNDEHTWVALTLPTEAGTLSALRLWAEPRAGVLLYLSLVMAFMLLVLAVSRSTPAPDRKHA